MFIKEMVKKIVYGNKYSNEKYINYLKKMGVRIGERTTFFAPTNTVIDLTRPWLIEIGNDVQITEGVTILTHGYDWSVLKGKYGKVFGSAGKVKIGNNVFIGMNTTILKGITIGDNVIIGANSLINKDIPNDCVYAGNPAKYIMPLEDYYKKRELCQEKEAIELVREYRKVYGENPSEEDLSEFFWLFTNKYDDSISQSWKRQINNVGNAERTIKLLNNNVSRYKNMYDFLDSIKED